MHTTRSKNETSFTNQKTFKSPQVYLLITYLFIYIPTYTRLNTSILNTVTVTQNYIRVYLRLKVQIQPKHITHADPYACNNAAFRVKMHCIFYHGFNQITVSDGCVPSLRKIFNVLFISCTNFMLYRQFQEVICPPICTRFLIENH